MAEQAPKTRDAWAGAPSGWVSLRALPDAVAEATGADTARVAALLRPMIETGKLPYRPPLASLAADENALRSIRVTPGGITYGRVDSDGHPLRPTPPTWVVVFRPGSPLLDRIEADLPAAVALVKAAIRLADTASTGNHKRGRAPSGYAESDAPLVEEMRAMIRDGRARGPWDAAQAVADRAAGSRHGDTRVKRLVARYLRTARG